MKINRQTSSPIGGGWIHPQYPTRVEYTHSIPCVSYEAAKRGQVLMTARVRRGTTPASCGSSTLHLSEVRSKHCHYSQTPRAQSPPHSIPFFISCAILLTGLHQSPEVSTILLRPSNFSTLPPLLLPRCTRVKRKPHHCGWWFVDCFFLPLWRTWKNVGDVCLLT